MTVRQREQALGLTIRLRSRRLTEVTALAESRANRKLGGQSSPADLNLPLADNALAIGRGTSVLWALHNQVARPKTRLPVTFLSVAGG